MTAINDVTSDGAMVMTEQNALGGAAATREALYRGAVLLEHLSRKLQRRLGQNRHDEYAMYWQPRDERTAALQIYNTDDFATFDKGGMLDAEIIRPLVTSDSVVMDFGCGMGRVSKYVAPMCKVLWAVDASSVMLDLARKRLSGLDNVRYARSRDTVVPDVESASVDVIFSLLVLQHMEREDAFRTLKEFHRLLRPQGVLLVNFPNMLADVYLDGFVRGASISDTPSYPVRARVYTPQEVERLLPAAGFSVEIRAETEIWATCRPNPVQPVPVRSS